MYIKDWHWGSYLLEIKSKIRNYPPHKFIYLLRYVYVCVYKWTFIINKIYIFSNKYVCNQIILVRSLNELVFHANEYFIISCYKLDLCRVIKTISGFLVGGEVSLNLNSQQVEFSNNSIKERKKINYWQNRI